MLSDIEQYKQILEGDNKTVLKDMIQDQPVKPEYGKWTGKVVDNNDPQMLGRCRIKIIGYYDTINDNQLPWAVPDISFIGGKCGSQIIPEVDSMVRGYFENGDVQRPVYDSLAFNAYNSESDYTSIYRKNINNYPHSMVLMETDQGDSVVLNRKTGELVFTHRTGAVTMIDSNGNISVRTGSTGTGNMNIDVNGNCNLSVSGNMDVNSNGNVKVNALGTIELGDNPAMQPCNNLKNCYICGAIHSTQQKVKC